MQQEYNRDIDLLVQNIMFDLRPAIYNALMSRLKSILYQHNEETINEIIDTIIKTLQKNNPKDTAEIKILHIKDPVKIICPCCKREAEVDRDDFYKFNFFCPWCGYKYKTRMIIEPSLE